MYTHIHQICVQQPITSSLQINAWSNAHNQNCFALKSSGIMHGMHGMGTVCIRACMHVHVNQYLYIYHIYIYIYIIAANPTFARIGSRISLDMLKSMRTVSVFFRLCKD